MKTKSGNETPYLAAPALFHDDFSGDLSAGSDESLWQLRPVPGFPVGDGIVRTGPDGLVVTPTASDPRTGQPAFATPPSSGPVDHLRWALMANRQSAAGFPGFGAGTAGQLSVTAEVALSTYNVERHALGESIADPSREFKLGAGVLIFMDRETGVVFDFILTDRVLFAVYERLAFPGTEHAGFSYAVPVRDRQPADFHQLTITYDTAKGEAAWYVGQDQVLLVDQIGQRALSSRYLARDNGKPAEDAAPQQLTCGLALFADHFFGQGARLAARYVEVRKAGA
jgi:hypothetical protein